MYTASRVLIGILITSICSCASIDKSSVQATSGAPTAAFVADLSIEKDENVPTFAIAIEPVWDAGTVSAVTTTGDANVRVRRYLDLEGTVSGSSRTTFENWYPSNRTNQIAAQLSSALFGIGNFKVLAREVVRKRSGGVYEYSNPSLYSNARGPFVMRARITEYEARSEYEKTKLNAGLYDNKNEQGVGVVAIDVEVVDGRDGSIVAAYPVRASFGFKDREEGTGHLPIYTIRQSAQSALDQALRKASNDAAQELWRRLSQQVS